MSTLQLRERRDGEITTLAASGELDISTAAELEAAVRRLCADPAHNVILDLSGVSLMDTAGVGTLVACKQLFDESDCGFWVMSPRAPVRRILERFGLMNNMPFRNGRASSS